MKNPWVIIGIITVVLFGGAIWFSNQATEANNAGVEAKEQVKGNPEAEVVLVEYSDFQCPACKSFQPFVETVIDQYGDNLRFEYKHFPLPIHGNALTAAMAAEAAGQQDKFFEYHDLLFDNQSEWSMAASPSLLFISYAEELGLDIDTFRRHMKSTILQDKVKKDMNEGYEMKITGTPTFFLNGEKMQLQSYQDFIEQIAVKVDPAAASTTNLNEGGQVKFGL